MSEARKLRMRNAEDFFGFLSYHERISHSTMSVKLGKRRLVMRKLRNLTLTVSRGPWRFRSWLSGLDSLNVVSGCLGTLVRTNSDQQLLYRELRGCLLFVRRFRRRSRGLCLAWLQCMIHSRLEHRHLYCWTLEMVILKNQLRIRRPLKFVFCLPFNMWCKCFICTDMYIFSLGRNRCPGTPCLSFITFMGKSACSRVDGRGTTCDVTPGSDCRYNIRF
jgi:hypothetical protein